ncbi:MAG: DNA repair protein RecO [Thermoclostridium sp.]|nr:DNA repair protein RecO [Thermoclostridium sp.]
MAYIKIRGVVVREVAAGDYDKILTVISDELGKISVSARGVRRSGNRYSAGTQVLSYCDWILYKGKNTYILNSCEIIHPFYEIRQDLTLLAYAAHLLEMTQDSILENQPSKEPLTLLLHALHALTNKNKNLELIIRVFSLKLVQIMGFTPYLSGCCKCGTKEIDEIYFSFEGCGFICDSCKGSTGNHLRIEPGTARALIYVICAEIREVFGFELSEEALRNFSGIVDKYCGDRLEKKYCRNLFLKELQ